MASVGQDRTILLLLSLTVKRAFVDAYPSKSAKTRCTSPGIVGSGRSFRTLHETHLSVKIAVGGPVARRLANSPRWKDRKEWLIHMGVGYCVSALHRMTFLDTSAMSTRAPVRGRDSTVDSVAAFWGAQVGEGTVRFRSPILEDILAWRERLATKYRDQLDEGLTWNEGSTFEVSEDVATSDDVMFHYVAAVLDQRGKSEFSKLMGAGKPPSQELDAAFVEATRRGFGGRFPHLMLGASLWLPFKSSLMIEEPNWEGHVGRYGSVYHFVDEVTTVRAAIADAQPSVIHSSVAEPSDQVMDAAWQASSTIVRLATIAAAQHLPLWTTG